MALKISLVILAIISIIIFVGIYCPIIAYYAYKTKQFENHAIMKKRNPRLTIALSIISICWILSFVITILIYCFNNNRSRTLANLSSFFVIAIYLCFTYTLIWRLWLQYYAILLAVSLLKSSWQTIIKPDAAAVTNNWYIAGATQQTWGNPKYLKKRMLLIIISNIFLYAVVYFIRFYPVFFILRIILILVPWVAIYILYKKIPVFHDEIGISREIKQVMIAYSLMGILCILLFITLAAYVVSSPNEESAVIDACFAVSIHLIAAISFISSMCMTWYVLKTYVVGNDDIDADGSSHHVLHIALEEIMCSMDAIDLLMKWLQKEYSQENLLFIIEITLFQRSIAKFVEFNAGQPQLKKYGINLFDLNQKLLQVPPTCPLSSIVEGEYEDVIQKYGTLIYPGKILPFVEREQLRFKHAAWLLFEKYIIMDSDLAVNISGVDRNALLDDMENYDIWMKNKSYDNIEKLFNLFEKAKEEIKALINGDSVSRLRRSDDDEDGIYQKIENIFEQILSKTRTKVIAHESIVPQASDDFS